MSYQLNKTDGTVLTDLIDGQLDNTSTNLTLIGRNYTGYGEFFNENFIKLLENFANTAAPSNPLTGQTWWDTSEQRLKVYNGNQWNAAGGPFVQNTRPQMVAGDLWIDNVQNQLYVFDGTDLTLIGPDYTESQGQSGFSARTLNDINGGSHTIIDLYIGGDLIAVLSNEEFIPSSGDKINAFISIDNTVGTIFKGINLLEDQEFEFFGIADRARALIDEQNQIVTVDKFLPTDKDGITTGTLTIQNTGGISIGLSQNNVQRVLGNNFYIENQLQDHNLRLRVNSSEYGSVGVDAIYIDAANGNVGIFNINRVPEYTLDVAGDCRIEGNLIVEGDTSYFDTSTLRVEDKNIELAVLSDSTRGTDAEINNAGIIIGSQNFDKEFLWKQASNSWTANVNIDLQNTTESYKIGGVEKVSNTSIHETVTSATGLTQLGTLQNLSVDNINIDGVTISSSLNLIVNSANGIEITTNGNILLDPTSPTPVAQIKNLAFPTDQTDAASKAYVDSRTVIETIALSLDISGLGVGSTLINNVSSYLNDLFPATADNIGKIARIHAVNYSAATVTGIQVTVRDDTEIDAGETLTVSRIDVDSNGTQNESVVQDIVGTNPTSGTVNLIPSRQLMVYESNGASWDYVIADSITYT